MGQLITAFARLAALLEQAIHGTDRAVILSFVEQRGINSGWRAILETFVVKMSQDRFAFRRTECTCRRRPRRGPRRKRSPTAIPIVRSARHIEGLASST